MAELNSHRSLRQVNDITQHAGVPAEVKNPTPRLPHITPHIFRHSITRYLKSIGLGVEWAQNFLGHNSIKTTMDIYGTISIDEMQEVAERRLA